LICFEFFFFLKKKKRRLFKGSEKVSFVRALMLGHIFSRFGSVSRIWQHTARHAPYRTYVWTPQDMERRKWIYDHTISTCTDTKDTERVIEMLTDNSEDNNWENAALMRIVVNSRVWRFPYTEGDKARVYTTTHKTDAGTDQVILSLYSSEELFQRETDPGILLSPASFCLLDILPHIMQDEENMGSKLSSVVLNPTTDNESIFSFGVEDGDMYYLHTLRLGHDLYQKRLKRKKVTGLSKGCARLMKNENFFLVKKGDEYVGMKLKTPSEKLVVCTSYDVAWNFRETARGEEDDEKFDFELIGFSDIVKMSGHSDVALLFDHFDKRIQPLVSIIEKGQLKIDEVFTKEELEEIEAAKNEPYQEEELSSQDEQEVPSKKQ
jgi:hypothetical protein